MRAIAINGSPRKGWNTDMLLQQALKGAADAGAETELIQPDRAACFFSLKLRRLQ